MSDDGTPEPRKEARTFQPRGGVATQLLLRVAVFAVSVAAVVGAAAMIEPVTIFGIGVVQLIASVPLAIFAKRRGDAVLFRVAMIGGGLMFLLNAGCFGLIMLEGGIH